MNRPRLVLSALLLALAPAGTLAQVAAAPVTPVATVAVPAAVPAFDRTAATPGIGQPTPGAWNLQTQVTPIGTEAQNMVFDVLNPMMVTISIFVVGLLGWVVLRYRRSRNPNASRTSHNTVVEVVWTVVPVLILVWIAVPSFRLLANQYTPPKADLTIKATGHQWYWEFEYPDAGGFSFDSIMLTKDEAAKAGTPYQLDVDNRVVVPVGATVKVLVTAADVIHAFMIPAFWVQMDAVPGRINETWFKATKPGVYFGQCYQLCGTRHAFMPVAIEVVSKERYAAWIAAKQKENGIVPKAAATAAAEAATTPVAADPANASAAGAQAAPAPVAADTTATQPAPAVAAQAATN